MALALMASLGQQAHLDAQQANLALGMPAGDHAVVGIHETTMQATVEHASATFLPLKLAGFAQRDRLRHDIPVLLGTEGPGPHIRLPELGSLYLSNSQEATRLLRIDAAGAVSVLYTARRQAAATLMDEWIAVSPDGTHALLATRPELGGSVMLLDIAGNGNPRDLTATHDALDIDGLSLRLGAADAWFTAAGALYHSDLTASARKLDLGLLPGETLLPETAMSRSGKALAVVVENGAGLRNLLTVDATGHVTRATTTAMDYDTPSYDLPIGPLLAISDDGSTLAWRRTVITKELFTQRMATATSDPPSQITRDAMFTDTIDNVGILGFTAGGLLVFAAGEITNDPTHAIDGADMYMVDPVGGAAAGEPQNLTQTSGEATPPFLVHGELEIQDMYLDPRGERLIFTVDPINGADFGLHTASIRNPGDYRQILPQLAGTPQIHAAGDAVLILSQPEVPGTMLHEVYLLPPENDPTGLTRIGGTSIANVSFDRFTSTRRGHLAAFAANLGPGLSMPVLVDVTEQTMRAALPSVFALSPTLAFTPQERLALGVGPAGAANGPFLWAGLKLAAPPLLYPVSSGQGFPLDH